MRIMLNWLSPVAWLLLALSPAAHAQSPGQLTPPVKTYLALPPDAISRAALEAAMPVILDVLAVHSCAKERDDLARLNFWGVPGVDLADRNWNFLPSTWMNRHDSRVCLAIRTVDRVVLPTPSILKFRTVYIAEDSGETIWFTFELRKMQDDSWRVARIRANAD